MPLIHPGLTVLSGTPLCQCFCHVASGAQDLTLGRFCVTALFFPRPYFVAGLLLWIDMIKLQILCGAAVLALFSREKLQAPLRCPLFLILTLHIKIPIWHAT